MKNIFLMMLAVVMMAMWGCTSSRVVAVRERPPMHVVRTPPPRPGYIWIDRGYAYRGGRYVWLNGYWAPPRPHRTWAPGYWQRGQHGWMWRGGRWR